MTPYRCWWIGVVVLGLWFGISTKCVVLAQTDSGSLRELIQQSQRSAQSGELDNAIVHAESALELEPENQQLLYWAARLYSFNANEEHQAKRYDDAAQSLDQCINRLKSIAKFQKELSEEHQRLLSTSLYNLACAQSLDGDTKSALLSLRSAVESGFSDLKLVETDSDLKALRERAGFQKVVSELRGKPIVRQKILGDQGYQLFGQGRFPEAIKTYQAQLAILKKLYPSDQYPDGHEYLAMCLMNVGVNLFSNGEEDEGQVYLKQALEMNRKLFPKEDYPNGHPRLAYNLDALAHVLKAQGDYAGAVRIYRQVLEMNQRLYPQDQFPQGHPDVASGLNNLGALLQYQGGYAESRDCHEQALEIYQRLYPPDRHPQGHQDLALSLDNLSRVLDSLGNFELATKYCEQALLMRQKLYPSKQFPNGHVDLASSFQSLGMLQQGLGAFDKAHDNYQQALRMHERLYPPARFPNGHPDIANSLSSLAVVLRVQGDYASALKYQVKALKIRERMFPPKQYPAGHPDLASSLESLATLMQSQGRYAEARAYYEQALRIYRRFYSPKDFPRGHPNLAECISRMGVLLHEQGKYVAAREYYEEALQMNQRVFPKSQFQNGHFALAANLNNLGSLLISQGDYSAGDDFIQQALEMKVRLCPKEQFPNGHPDLATTLTNVAALLQTQGEYSKAREYFKRALKMCEEIYPQKDYPNGHHELANCFSNLGVQSRLEGNFVLAQEYYTRSLEMRQRLFPPDEYPNGHPDLTLTMGSLGFLLDLQGKSSDAQDIYEQALEMTRKLYPPEDYPDGHPDLRDSLSNLSFFLRRHREYSKSRDFFGEALEMNRQLINRFASAASEAEMLNLLASQTDMLGGVLSLPDDGGSTDYRFVWHSRGLVQRVLTSRQARLEGIADPAQLEQLHRYRQTRRLIAKLALAPSGSDQASSRGERIRALTEEKEQLERNLAGLIAGIRIEASQGNPDELIRVMPESTAYVDMLRYDHWRSLDANSDSVDDDVAPRYVAFVMQRGKEVCRVDLDEAEPIEDAVRRWRAAIQLERSTAADEELRRLVWSPIERVLSSSVRTIYISPDAALSAVPWVALPGRERGTVLLDQYLIATVPSGPFLFSQLRDSSPSSDWERVLAIGGIDYDKPAAIADMGMVDQVSRSPLINETNNQTGDERAGAGSVSRWQPLSNSRSEVKGLAKMAGDGRTVDLLVDSEASTSRVMQSLPKVDVAHFATHGFFADANFRKLSAISNEFFVQNEQSVGAERQSVASRSPLLATGIVLSGANMPCDLDQWGAPTGDHGILTGEAIAALPLSNLKLAVLSACDTNVGEIASGEGVFSLQRAFHIAGAHNVIASLWKVPDRPTAALMNKFYENLWNKKQTPQEALRNAQLAIFRNPERVEGWAQERALLSKKTTKISNESTSKKVQDAPDVSSDTAPVRWWAAFGISGRGR